MSKPTCADCGLELTVVNDDSGRNDSYAYCIVCDVDKAQQRYNLEKLGESCD